MYPVIQVVPTSGTYGRCYHQEVGYKPADAEYSNQSDDTDRSDDPDAKVGR